MPNVETRPDVKIYEDERWDFAKGLEKVKIFKWTRFMK